MEGLEALSLGLEKIKLAKKILSDADPKATPKSPIGLTNSEIAAFSRKMSEAIAHLNGARGGQSTAARLKNLANSAGK